MATLKAWWKFDVVNTNTTPDASGNNNTASLANGPTLVGGKINNALDFDGVNDYVTVADSTSLRPSTISMTAWVYPRTTPPVNVNMKIAEKWSATSASYGIFVNGYASNVLTFRCNVSGTLRTVDTLLALGINQWKFITGTFSGTQLKVYVDGQLKNTANYTGTLTASYDSSPLWVARPSGGSFFNGVIDELRIYDGALTDQEVLDLYNSPLLCWNYRARYKNSERMYTANGSGKYPKELKVPSSVDISSGVMMDEGKLINSNQYRVL